MSKNKWPWFDEPHEGIQEHADRYLKILMENDKLPEGANIDVALAVHRLVEGRVTSKYDLESVERKWTQ